MSDQFMLFRILVLIDIVNSHNLHLIDQDLFETLYRSSINQLNQSLGVDDLNYLFRDILFEFWEFLVHLFELSSDYTHELSEFLILLAGFPNFDVWDS